MNDGDAVRYLHRGNTVTVVFVRLRTRSRVPFVRSFARPARTQLLVRFARRVSFGDSADIGTSRLTIRPSYGEAI